MSKTTKKMNKIKINNQGFTLIEMAVVLVIMGVIVSAVMVGRDVQRSAENMKIKRTFIDQWALTYQNYYMRMGIPIGDNRFRPTKMVNGGTVDDTGGVFAGNEISAANVTPAMICGGETGTIAGRAIQVNRSLQDIVLAAGLELPTGKGPGEENRYPYLDANGLARELVICFQYNGATATNAASGVGNLMVITGLTPDLARQLSVNIKGSSDANTGLFRQAFATPPATFTGNYSTTQVDWTNNIIGNDAITYTQASGDSVSNTSNAPTDTTAVTNETAAANIQEKRVNAVVAYYKMQM